MALSSPRLEHCHKGRKLGCRDKKCRDRRRCAVTPRRFFPSLPPYNLPIAPLWTSSSTQRFPHFVSTRVHCRDLQRLWSDLTPRGRLIMSSFRTNTRWTIFTVIETAPMNSHSFWHADTIAMVCRLTNSRMVQHTPTQNSPKMLTISETHVHVSIS